MAYEELKNHGVTADTPKNIMLGAGTLHKGFVYGYYLLTAKPANWASAYTSYFTRSGTSPNYTYTAVTGQTAPTWAADTYYYKGWNFAESLVGATSGGNKLTITPEITTVEVDGALVKVKGLDFKTGEVAKLETNLVEITPELLKTTVIGELVTSDVEGYNLIESKADIEEGDYYDNLAFVGKKTDGTPIIIILDNALCTSGFEGEAKNKENTVVKCTFECYQDVTGDLAKLPYHIYYPTPANANG